MTLSWSSSANDVLCASHRPIQGPRRYAINAGGCDADDYDTGGDPQGPGEALETLQRLGSISVGSGNWPACADTGAPAGLSASRCKRSDCAEAEDGSGELSGAQVRPNYHRGGRS